MNFSMFLEQHLNFDFTKYIVEVVDDNDDITEHKKYIKAIDNIFKKVLKL